jgi:hypothetical protein
MRETRAHPVQEAIKGLTMTPEGVLHKAPVNPIAPLKDCRVIIQPKEVKVVLADKADDLRFHPGHHLRLG